ncbi:type IV pilus secretin PilQ [Paracidovorax sp. MALMAid1276]|uniref:type IV pilus secretin PilQ n=1 Tax=Paracidovorax sp. MALMAid1276 TaxID=3411631 RepID=UPI003B9B3DCE
MKFTKAKPVKIGQLVLTLSASLFMSLGAWAQASIQSVSSAVQGGADVVRIDFAESPKSLPTGFSIQSPARIALDFPGMANGSGKNAFEINQGNLKSINVVQAGDRARVVLNLKQPSSYSAEIQGKSLLVTLGTQGAGAVSAQQAPSQVFSDAVGNDVQAIRDVDFRRGSDGSGRVVISLPSSQVGVDIRQQGKGLTVDFLRSTLPEGLRRRLDVTDFGTPVQVISTSQQNDRVRMVIEPVGEWEHSAYQSDSQFVVEVRSKKVDLSKLTQGPGYSGEKLSLNFQNIEVRSLLQVIADFTNFNIVTSDTVTGSLTLRLKDVPWDQALQIIMDAKGLGMRKSGTVLWIAPKDEIDDRIKKDYEAAQAIQKLEPLRTQAFQMNYAKAADMVLQLTASSGGSGGGSTNNRFLSERGSAISEPRTNQLFVTDTPAKLEEVRQLLATLDVAVRQVMIEARIVEASDTFGRSLGIRLGATDLRANRGGDGGYGLGSGNRVAFGTSYSNAVATTGAGGSVNTLGNFVNLPAQAQGGYDPASFAISIFNSAANRFLNLEISALEADGKGKIVSSPRVVTADQTKASIEQGTEFPYPVTAPNGGTVIAFKKAVLKLEVTPQITPEGNIILDLDVNKDSPGEVLNNVRAINTKHIKTQVLVENGGTVVIGGIFELFEDNTESKVPVLGDIPGLGNLFKTRTKQANKQEMLVFITPKVITDRSAIR